MPSYYLDRIAKPNGMREVHVSTCEKLPPETYRIYIGTFDHCRGAVKEGRLLYEQVRGCYWCAPDCHGD